MGKKLRLDIINPDRTLYGANVNMVIVRATTGELGILAGHAPLVALLDPRPVRILLDEGEHEVSLKGGIMQVKPEGVTILTFP
ncbi:ATP synthase F1 subunit epsilon [Sporomusa aerivorans]|uniref:ATP synthase F1 subunit epsilon n=1 Tax=Sporomusa aerivorans TaxID=204936 RepID=UPI00352AFD70